MFFEMTPTFNGPLMDRLANLDGTGGRDAAFCFVEIQTAIFPFEITMPDQCSSHLFGLRHHVLISDVKNSPRQNPVPMIHEALIDLVVSTQFLEIIGKFLCRRKILREARKTRIHW